MSCKCFSRFVIWCLTLWAGSGDTLINLFFRVCHLWAFPTPRLPKRFPMLSPGTSCDFVLLRFYLFIFKEGKEGRKRNINVWLPLERPLLGTWPATQACGGDKSNQPPFGLQASTQSTKPHQPGHVILTFTFLLCLECLVSGLSCGSMFLLQMPPTCPLTIC